MNRTELEKAFSSIRYLLNAYSDSFRGRVSTPTHLEFWTEVKKGEQVLFCRLVVMADYVEFRFPSVSLSPSITEDLNEDFISMQHDKSSFRIQKLTPAIAMDINELLQRGYRLYSHNHWI